MGCFMADVLAECLNPVERDWCIPCCELELGEKLADIQARTNRGIPKGKYYKGLIAEREREIVAARTRPRGSSRWE